ncbi:hypothetical protein DK842_04470 [Chromobacterium phragmitis]|uniref:Class I SAM-dependent methyltransferase n=1 Tax=Chromobacterium phragmitis TaxID=2202141 RepID=A0A344UH42_9NEIS|nr:class I SAM-dependent methyltransferase [Chromobacterium phragmitis]AXE29231.1 hypothetical protein DK842_04470 [Chromobacterium phragmitis]AXE34590.1 hypothetical protein DK843_09935 [Chromobacterium phragmitis]
MGFSPEWERQFSSGAHLSRWPWSDLVSLCRRHARHLPSEARILELGCGVGANIPFFLAQGWRYFAVEGSASAAAQAARDFPMLQDAVRVADFTAELPFSGAFDLVVDRAALTHNCERDIRLALARVRECLVPGGLYIGVDWFSTRHADYGRGAAAEDAWTRRDYEQGAFGGVGRVHFSDSGHLRDLFAGWEWLAMEEKTIERFAPEPATLAMWSFVVRKP